MIAMLAGLIFESIRVSRSWTTVLGIFTISYLFSLLGFLPGKRERVYNFDNHIDMWPYLFIFIFALFFGIGYKDKITAKLTEGITLLLSLSFIYWAIDYGYVNYHNWLTIALLTIGLLFSLFSIYNALTHAQLTKTSRLVLSFWSTIILFVFSIDSIIRVFSNPAIESSYLFDGLYIGIQYFLLGVSAVYIIQNFMLLTDFFPSRNGDYKKDLKKK